MAPRRPDNHRKNSASAVGGTRFRHKTKAGRETVLENSRPRKGALPLSPLAKRLPTGGGGCRSRPGGVPFRVIDPQKIAAAFFDCMKRLSIAVFDVDASSSLLQAGSSLNDLEIPHRKNGWSNGFALRRPPYTSHSSLPTSHMGIEKEIVSVSCGNYHFAIILHFFYLGSRRSVQIKQHH